MLFAGQVFGCPRSGHASITVLSVRRGAALKIKAGDELFRAYQHAKPAASLA
jgi:hypothetical protein